MSEKQAAEVLGEALDNPVPGMERLGRIGVLFPGNMTRWERLRLKFWALLRNERRLQLVTLESLNRRYQEEATAHENQTTV